MQETLPCGNWYLDLRAIDLLTSKEYNNHRSIYNKNNNKLENLDQPVDAKKQKKKTQPGFVQRQL